MATSNFAALLANTSPSSPVTTWPPRARFLGSTSSSSTATTPTSTSESRFGSSSAVDPAATAKPAVTAKPIKDLRTPDDSIPSYKGFIQVSVSTAAHQQTFDVHESLITTRSPFFKKAMTGNWKEAQERVVKLPDDEPVIF
ncbi:hypothetical protein EK21DRAFT_117548 [Setomelanomma holmii]|uniref:BTB domain-containing protein n=1 Tax=Setomelanomma holmii TaxID=210430 RepID=A0A9P4GXE5_9PLEO|nr:hypothetical protein EK21DRAFT_117548 [Setomelanomma holmii]